jgi:hypothetical protein
MRTPLVPPDTLPDEVARLATEFAKRFKVSPLRGRLQSREEYKALLEQSIAEGKISPNLRLLTGIQNGIIVD